MPRRDATGPRGQGPMTGRGMGPCAGNTGPLTGPGRGPGLGRGLGLGLGLGWGWRRGGRRWAGQMPVAPVDDAAMLRQQADALESQLAAIKQRLEVLDGKNE
jgi:hypothetical protein